MNFKYEICKFYDCPEKIIQVRRTVFIEEQNTPESEEWNDNEELNSIYCICIIDEKIVGCGRIRSYAQDIYKMERIAVLKNFRGRHIGREIVRRLVRHSSRLNEECSIIAYAQVAALSLYQKLGFIVVSNSFLDVDIEHKTIYYSTRDGLKHFVNNHEEQSSCKYYEIFHPSCMKQLREMNERLQCYRTLNIHALSLMLDATDLPNIICSRFSNFVIIALQAHGRENIENNEMEDIMSLGNELLFLADEELNTGHYRNVKDCWRYLYGAVQCVRCFLFVKWKEIQRALKCADYGLCMGLVDESILPLRKFTNALHSSLPVPDSGIINPQYFEKCELSIAKVYPTIPLKEITNECEETIIKYCHHEKPLIIRNIYNKMEAVQKWNFTYFFEKMHARTFPVEIGSSYSAEGSSQKMMSFKDFLVNRNNETLYLGQHNIFKQIEFLLDDIIIPNICFYNDINIENVERNTWIGPANTIFGKKLIRLCAPKWGRNMYPIDGILSNTSQIDGEFPDFEKFPKFGKVEEIFETVVGPGDALFIPRGWWHMVKSLTPSISLSHWFD
ncbi:unnamed protein product [Caenorhabditis bovis]|uniref:Uncharacterized protein n=1 Tax=Caenorhabditis bovis TaxID=2654633 RepID=A0A8S1E9C4_9PELO|nr:unnamed protein product [Caenorhabditis bovis]